MNEAGIAIKKLREELGLTQYDLSNMTGISQSSIARIESGNTRGSVRLLQTIAQSVGRELKITFEES